MQLLAPKHVKALLMTACFLYRHSCSTYCLQPLAQPSSPHSFCTLSGVLVFWEMYNQLCTLEQVIALSPPYGAV